MPYCAEGCTNELLNNGECDIKCNSATCAYDNGMCEQVTECEAGEYIDNDICLECPSPCNTCASVSYCNSCLVS